jgi:hypothetical protein
LPAAVVVVGAEEAAAGGVAEAVGARGPAEGSRPRAAGLDQAAALVRLARARVQPVGRLPLGRRADRLLLGQRADRLRRDPRQDVRQALKAQRDQVVLQPVPSARQQPQA